MKRALSAILALTMCLSLCACSGVKQEVYDAAKAGYDELSSKYDVLKAKVEKYSTVIDALEKEDYDGAVEAVNAMRPAPDVTEVEITMDNLWDYFEITESRNEETDAQGNLKRLTINRSLTLKEAYTLADREEYPTDVAVGFEYDENLNLYYLPCTIDFEAWTCDVSAANRRSNHESKMAHFPTSAFLDNYSANAKWSTDYAALYSIDNFEILNASGTLYLVSK